MKDRIMANSETPKEANGIIWVDSTGEKARNSSQQSCLCVAAQETGRRDPGTLGSPGEGTQEMGSTSQLVSLIL